MALMFRFMLTLANTKIDQSEIIVSDAKEATAEVADANAGYARLSEVFESSARRWELIVYPSLFAFIILAAYGFYLIYNLARDDFGQSRYRVVYTLRSYRERAAPARILPSATAILGFARCG